MTTERRPIFTLRLAGKPGMAGIRELRALLKRLLRQHGFRALDVREKHDAAARVRPLADGIEETAVGPPNKKCPLLF